MSISKLDLSQPVFLQFNSKKFWEISLLNGNKTQIRYGKLTLNVEVSDTVQTVEKAHKSYDECVAYINRVIDVKRLKGYQGEVIPASTQNKPSASTPFVIKVSAAVDNSKDDESSRNAIEAEEDDDDTTDPKSQCYLQQNTSWKAQFVILTRTKKSVQEITGSVGPRPNWNASTTDLLSEANAIEYLENQIEAYSKKNYEKSNAQYFIKLKEYNDSISSQASDTSTAGGLAVPSLYQRQMQKRKASYQNSDDDSRSNVSDSSDKTDQTRITVMDLSFDGIDDSNISSVSQTGITYGSLGKPGVMEGGVLLAEAAPDDMDPTGWYGSEKMDGVRAVWTGTTFYSRNGNEFFPPAFFIKNFPKATLDGELFTKRDDFQKCVSIVKKQNKEKLQEFDDRWKEITYLVYDAPHLDKPFKERIAALQEQLPKIDNPYIKCLPHVVIKNREHLEAQLDKTLEKKGEGIMLRNPESYYEHRRSKNLLKVKVFIDEEAVVIGSEKGHGRCADMMGAILCRLKNGIEFKIGSGFNDAQRMRPPKKGAIVTFKYQNQTKEGKPRFPIFLRVKQGADF